MGPSGHCPVCSRKAGPRPANRDWPFCSARCRLVDLGKWLGEEYRVPGERAGDGGDADEGEALP